MTTTRSSIPIPRNEPIKGYLVGSKERIDLEEKIKEMKANPIEIPVIIGGKEIKTNNMYNVTCPHNHKLVLAKCHQAGEKEIKEAIENCIEARQKWAKLPSDQRISVFLKAAELLSVKYTATMNAATILGQSKNFYQAEIDSTCEIIDFLRFNAKFAEEIYSEQPTSSPGVWNRNTYRPLEGFVYAITPFNFTAIGGNLPTACAMMGNVVIWKPARYALLSSYYFMKIMEEAGLPAGVINFIPGDPGLITDICIKSPYFAGIHYTGSTSVFNDMWKMIGNNISNYKSYPRIVGETGGKDFIVAHKSADIDNLVANLIRGSFEYAGQKCSACSRAYIPAEIWEKVKEKLLEQMKKVKMGNPEEPDTLVNAVIHKRSFDNAKSYIEWAQKSDECEILFGGKCDDSVGYFIEPTIVITKNPKNKIITEEIFAPILTLYIYKEPYEDLLKIVDDHPYALTGSIFAQDRYAIDIADKLLENASGNFYINDKCTGAVVGQQPFGGARISGTNDKAGSKLNLLRWVSSRTIKETFVPIKCFSYPYMNEKK